MSDDIIDSGLDTDTGAQAGVKKPNNRRFKDTSARLRRGGQDGARLSNRASVDWRQDSARVCDPARPDFAEASIAELVEVLRKSRTAEALLDAAPDIEICYDLQSPAAQFYPREGKAIITLNPDRMRGELLNQLARELRRAWQHRSGALVNPLTFEPDEAILINRAQAADALMISVRIAWELKLGGEQEAWNALAGSPMADVGRIFEVKAQADFRTLNNGEAARAAYDKFFEDTRTRPYDKRLIHQMLLDEHGGIRKGAKSQKISVDLFKRLGEMPGGRNYLTMRGGRAPTDACYATVEDRSNANFLWFIKFERSFHEKEMQMVQESVKLSAEIVDFAKWSLQSRRDEEAGL
jgi:hypothetical protein